MPLHPDCVRIGCQCALLTDMLHDAHRMYQERITHLTRKDRGIMESKGYALWCKPGSHPFGDDDLKRKPLTTIDDDGNEVTYWMCSEHRPDYMNAGAKPKRSLKDIMKEIENAEITE